MPLLTSYARRAEQRGPPESQTNYDQHMTRGDHTVNSQWSLFLSSFSRTTTSSTRSQGPPANQAPEHEREPPAARDRRGERRVLVDALNGSGRARLDQSKLEQAAAEPGGLRRQLRRPQDAVGGPVCRTSPSTGSGDRQYGPGPASGSIRIRVYRRAHGGEGRHNMRIGAPSQRET